MAKSKQYEDFSSVRFMTVLTPDTFSRSMIVVSTTFRQQDKMHGQTATGHAHTLNSMSIDFEHIKWKVIKNHTNIDDARKFHDKIAESMKWSDTQKSTPELIRESCIPRPDVKSG